MKQIHLLGKYLPELKTKYYNNYYYLTDKAKLFNPPQYLSEKNNYSSINNPPSTKKTLFFKNNLSNHKNKLTIDNSNITNIFSNNKNGNFSVKKITQKNDVKNFPFIREKEKNSNLYVNVPYKLNMNNRKIDSLSFVKRKEKNSQNQFTNCLTVISLKKNIIEKNSQSINNIPIKNKTIKDIIIENSNNKKITLPKMNTIKNEMKTILKTENEKQTYKTYFPKRTITEPNNKITPKKKEIKISKIKKDKSKKTKTEKKRQLICYDIISLPGTENGCQKINQDTFLVLTNVYNSKDIRIFGVFDGHGEKGDLISQEIKNYFENYFSNNNNFNNSNENINQNFYKKITENNFLELKNLCKKIDEQIYNSNNYKLTGSTVSLIILINDPFISKINKIISLNIGDSKSIIINKNNEIKELNIIHTPENETEKLRIIQNGGEVSKVDWDDNGPLRIFYKGEIYPGLALTRSFGDFESKELGVISEPDIKEFDIDDENIKMLIIATDGIWQFLSGEKVKDILLKFYEEDDIRGGVKKLSKISYDIWKIRNKEFIDDITVGVLFFK